MSKYKGKKILIVGFGASGVSAAKYLSKQGAKVTVTDLKQKSELHDSVVAATDLKIEYELGKHNETSFRSAELIIVSPGVPLNTKALEIAREAGIPITSEVEIAAQGIKEPVIGITGTNGKTTVTTLIGEMLKADDKKTFVGGNIGVPLTEYLNEGTKADYVVSELSSFQLDLCQKLVPAVAVFTNVDPDHLDRYSSFEAYVASKKRLLKACDRNTYIVLNHDHPIVQSFAGETNGKVIWFTKKNPLSVGGAFAEQFVGCYYDATQKKIIGKFGGKEETYDVAGLRIFGLHNKENVMAAICAARAIGVSPTAIQKTIDGFPGIAHRLEFVRKKDGVYLINDSKATNPDSMARALEAFPSNPIILIAGGKDKNFEFAQLQNLVKSRCKLLILMGEAKEKINRALGDFVETYMVGTFEEAVLLSFQKSRNGDIILLSPGCSSLDMFRNYEERGDYFKKMVLQL